jgi:poly-gamma-glutamate synthesis protein (capsule biosynthesis protein)
MKLTKQLKLCLSIPLWTAAILLFTGGIWGREILDFNGKQQVLSYVARMPSANEPVRILSTGDMMLGRSVNYLGVKNGDLSWSYKQMSSFLKEFDYVVGNLENPIIENCPLTNEGMIFCADKRAGEALKTSGINLLTLANNHIFNYGVSGQEQTQKILTSSGLDALAEGEFLTKVVAGKTFGWLAFDDVSKTLKLEEVKRQVTSASKKVNHLLVAIHFGSEYRYLPTPRQEELAKTIIDAGARVVLGNHSHWLGAVELYGGGVIIYSHGNFVFDQMWSEETKEGMVASLEFDVRNLRQIVIYPVYITDYGRVNLATSTKATKILEQVKEISGLGEVVGERLMVDIPD